MEYKWKILKSHKIDSDDYKSMLVIGDYKHELEKVYDRFSKTLERMSNTYSKMTGINKEDLFSEALMGLVHAINSYNPKLYKNKSFRSYSITVIKNYLSNYCRKHSSSIDIPIYISKSIKLYKQLIDEIDSENPDQDKIEQYKKFLDRIATRANITLKELIERIEFLPVEIEYTEDQLFYQTPVENEELSMDTKRFIDRLDSDEKDIAYMIMEGYSYREIGQKYNKSHTWAMNKVKGMSVKYK